MNDQIGRLYAHDIRAAGVAFPTAPAADGPATGCSYILVTPDGERTMNTYLGAAQQLTPADIDAAEVAASSIVYLEGYLWDPKDAKDAFVKAAAIAHQAGRQVALTLSDSFCVDRYRGEFLELMRQATVDLVFANEAELHSLYETSDFDTALAQLRSDVGLGIVTRSEKGCVVASKDGVSAVPAFPVRTMVDTTGAGDLFAAGFLFGLVRGAGHRECRPARGACGSRSDPAHWRATAGVAEGIGEAERVAGVRALHLAPLLPARRIPHSGAPVVCSEPEALAVLVFCSYIKL